MHSSAGHCRGKQCGQTLSKKGLPGPERLGHGPPPISFTHGAFSKPNSRLGSFQKLHRSLHSVDQTLWERRLVLLGVRGWDVALPLCPSRRLTCALSPTLPHSQAPTIFSSHLCVPSHGRGHPFIRNPLNCQLV